MDSKLYELAQSYKQIQEMAEELDNETLVDTLESIEDSIEIKIENIVKMIKHWNSIIEAIDNEEKRLKARKQVFKNKIDSLKTYAQIQMNHMGKKKIETPTFTVSVRNNQPSVKITDVNFIPKDFLVESEPTVDKKALGKYLKDGNKIMGAELVVNQSLQIK